MHQITVSDIPIDVERKDIKNLHLAVYPPAGRVRIAAPLRVDDEAVRLFAIERLSWIKKQQARFETQARQTERELVSGESHYFQGQRYLLDVTYQDSPSGVAIRNKTHMELSVRPGSGLERRKRVLNTWYRAQLKAQIPPLIEKWQAIAGIEVHDWGIKHMKTKWGTCNTEARRIWLNLELAKKPERFLEYIILHEMVHLLERYHNDRFTAYMDQFMPQWRSVREELNRFVLSHEEWDY
jgi:predicted metal-dependent hydrolase